MGGALYRSGPIPFHLSAEVRPPNHGAVASWRDCHITARARLPWTTSPIPKSPHRRGYPQEVRDAMRARRERAGATLRCNPYRGARKGLAVRLAGEELVVEWVEHEAACRGRPCGRSGAGSKRLRSVACRGESDWETKANPLAGILHVDDDLALDRGIDPRATVCAVESRSAVQEIIPAGHGPSSRFYIVAHEIPE